MTESTSVLTSVPNEVVHEAGPTPGRRRYRVAWADRSRFLSDVLGLSKALVGDGFATTARTSHWLPENPQLYAVEAEIVGESMETDGNYVRFGHAIVTVTYAEPVGTASAVTR
jgi:hypothetical protein